jgi:hypothetical protein
MHGALDNIFANKIQSFNRFGGGSPPVAYVTQPRGGSPPVAYVTRSITPLRENTSKGNTLKHQKFATKMMCEYRAAKPLAAAHKAVISALRMCFAKDCRIPGGSFLSWTGDTRLALRRHIRANRTIDAVGSPAGNPRQSYD